MAWNDPATQKQYAYIYKLEQRLNRIPAQRLGMTKRMAKMLIDELLEYPMSPEQKVKELVDLQIAELRQKST